MRRLLFLISELSSQFGPDLRILTRRLPPGFHYMTGENVDNRININPIDFVQVVESINGNIIAIIDGMGYIRPIRNERNQNVQILPRRNNSAVALHGLHIRRYQIEFNEMPPAHQPIPNPHNDNYPPNNNNHHPRNNNHYPNNFFPHPDNSNFDRSR